MGKQKINSVLILNRGEIAVRIAKTLNRLGIKSYGFTSNLDPSPLHAKFVDVLLHLEGDTISDSYLNIEQVIQLCKKNNIEAIHPGYGFLSENVNFAKSCEENNLVFIGPSADSISKMGSKAEAKRLMKKVGVPVVPGYEGEDQNIDILKSKALEIGFPVLIKASLGGGGKGMRIVHQESELEQAISSAKSEGLKSFGSDHLIIEKYIESPRHIEVQVFGDQCGNLIHLGERECSIQRRHQKIIEESPSVALDDELRNKICEAGIRSAKALDYYNAGTVEFILDQSGEFYFLEVNTRLQVEHPVTEERTGLDLVEWQLLVAEGNELPLKQDEIQFRGHAIECRIYAEDPENSFFPSTGDILFYKEPEAHLLRIDSSIEQGAVVSLNFDPMLAKVITYGQDRQQALKSMIWALENYPVLGLKTNHAFLLEILSDKKFFKGDIDTHFIDQNFSGWKQSGEEDYQELAKYLQKVSKTSSKKSQPHQGLLNTVWDECQAFRLGEL